jgi:hypothetical protein
VVTTVLGAWPALLAMRPLVAELPRFDLAGYDQLPLKARALSHAHALYKAATIPPEALPDLVHEGIKLRDLLRGDAQVLAARGLVDARRFAQVKLHNGHAALAVDLQVLAATLKDVWLGIEGKTCITHAELDQAVRLADKLLDEVGARETSVANAAQTVAIRQRAYTLLVDSYEDARHAVRFVRRAYGDADTIAPSLFAVRLRAAKRGEAKGVANGESGMHVVALPKE